MPTVSSSAPTQLGHVRLGLPGREGLDVGCLAETTAVVDVTADFQGGNCTIDPTSSCQAEANAFNACDVRRERRARRAIVRTVPISVALPPHASKRFMPPPEHKHLQRASLMSVPFSARMIAWLSLRPSKHVRLKTTAVLTTARLNPTPLTRAPASNYGDPSGDRSGSKEPALTMVAGARYAQRCPVEFGVPMEAVTAA